MVAFLGTVRPDIANLLHYRGKRRFGRQLAMPVTTLRPGKSYQVRVRALNALGWSPYSQPSALARQTGACRAAGGGVCNAGVGHGCGAGCGAWAPAGGLYPSPCMLAPATGGRCEKDGDGEVLE